MGGTTISAQDFNLDQGFLSASTAPCNALGQDCSTSPPTQTTVTTAALIGTYCTSNNAQLNTGAGNTQSIDICDCSPLFGIRVHTDATYDYGTTAASTTAPDTGPSGVCLDFTHVPCNQL